MFAEVAELISKLRGMDVETAVCNAVKAGDHAVYWTLLYYLWEDVHETLEIVANLPEDVRKRIESALRRRDPELAEDYLNAIFFYEEPYHIVVRELELNTITRGPYAIRLDPDDTNEQYQAALEDAVYYLRNAVRERMAPVLRKMEKDRFRVR